MRLLCLSAAALAVLSSALLRPRAAHASTLPDGTVRVAVLADTHVAGPEYPLGGETGPLDNASITRTQQRLYQAVRAINAIDPPPQLTLFGGDIVHNGVEQLGLLGYNLTGLDQLYNEPINGFKVAQALLSELYAPQLYVWGNHDNYVVCGDTGASPSKALAADIYSHFFGAAPYASQDVGDSWKVVALNSMLGYTWDAAHKQCNPKLSSYGEEQLRWLDAELAQGKHTLVMMHFPPTTSVLDEVETGERWRDLRSVLSAHGNVKLVLTGHFHKGLDWQDLYPFPAHIVPAVRYSPQNFLLLDLLPDGTFVEPDAEKNRGGARCSDWWSYEGVPRFKGVVQAKDAGDCGVPKAGDEAQFELGPVLDKASIPPLPRFNPERSCPFALASPFLEACGDGASRDCCDVVESVTMLVSSAPFSTCFCHPSFWQQAVDYMSAQHSVDLAATLNECISKHKKLIVFRGGPLTWCPAEVEAL